MGKKLTVGVLFGGRSVEHEISLRSAKNVIEAMNRDNYTIILIGIDKRNVWRLCQPDLFTNSGQNPGHIDLSLEGEELLISPGEDGKKLGIRGRPKEDITIDVFFPILHGPYGEDGTIQGLLKLMNIPFVGAGVLGSAAGMDKDVTKRILRDARIPIARFVCFHKEEEERLCFQEIRQKLGTTLFVKPANLGSSVGVSKVVTEAEFKMSVTEAFHYDKKIIIEEMVEGREIECSVLGNEHPVASLPGEIIANDTFYSYRAKYIDDNGAVLKVPAELPENIIREIQECAVRTFKVLCCEGMARVDLFLAKDNRIVVNEINTIPGFTKISMYPKLWEISGISYSKLIDKLIELAVDRYKNEKKLETSLTTN